MNSKIIAMTESSAFQLSRLAKRTNARNDCSEGYFIIIIIIIIIIIYFLKPHQGFPWGRGVGNSGAYHCFRTSWPNKSIRDESLSITRNS